MFASSKVSLDAYTVERRLLTNRTSREAVPGDCLHDVAHIELKPCDGILCSKKDQENPQGDNGENDPPPWQGGLNDVQTGHDGNETGEEGEDVPARWALVVVVLDHDLIMGVNFWIVQEDLFLFFRSLALVPPEEVGGGCKKVLEVSNTETVLEVAHSDEAPSRLDLGVIPQKHMDEVPGEAGVGCHKTENIA